MPLTYRKNLICNYARTDAIGPAQSSSAFCRCSVRLLYQAVSSRPSRQRQSQAVESNT